MAGCLLLMFLAVFLVAASALLRGWVLTYLWEWFAVPFGLPDIGLVHAIGLSLLVGFLTHEYTGLLIESKDETKYTATATGFLMPFVALLMGYIVHSFM